jgi:hypothetical protein
MRRFPPALRVRELARHAESLGLDGVALDLFFAVARIEATGHADAVRAELADTAKGLAGHEGRLYRRAVRLLVPEAGAGHLAGPSQAAPVRASSPDATREPFPRTGQGP